MFVHPLMPASVGEALLSLFVCVMNIRGDITYIVSTTACKDDYNSQLPFHWSCHEDDDLIISCPSIVVVMKGQLVVQSAHVRRPGILWSTSASIIAMIKRMIFLDHLQDDGRQHNDIDREHENEND